MKLKFIFVIPFLISGTLRAELNPTILYVGDSHSYGRLGTVIEKKLSTISDHVIMESSCGSTPSTWLGKNGYEKTVCGFWKKDGSDESRSKEHQTPKISDELARYRPEVTIVQLGTNIAAGEKPKNYTLSIVTMMKTINVDKSICIWIGPPDANSKIVTKEKLVETNQLLIELAKKNNCHYIDSLLLTKFPSNEKEGIHYSPSLSAEWGSKVSIQILNIIANIKELPPII
ncbi:MAG: SGNH/GDSL hydrolase family protein [Bacteriovorax sp.]|nr:SGNH/GDSL hydrolase family protein [Bacteriovorax sp.]